MKTVNEKFVVEESAHSHVLESESKINAVSLGDGVFDIALNGESIVTHGEHGTLAIESTRAIKYVQIEVNPITSELQRVFD